mgnify:CR=1 FL=1
MEEGVDPHAYFDAEKVPIYKGNIESELLLQWEDGKLSSLQCGERVPSAFRPTRIPVVQKEERLSHRSVQVRDAVHLPVESPTIEIPEHNPERLFEHDMQCAEECLLRDCFGLCGFEKDVFLCVSQHLLERLSSTTDASRTNRIKARLITIIVRKIVRDLALSKNQTTQVVNMLKAVICFVSPENEEVSDKIFASFTTCTRQSQADEAAKQNLCQSYMDQCLYFSISLDTTLFNKQHVLSCFARFAFINSLLHIPLFFHGVFGVKGRRTCSLHRPKAGRAQWAV